MAMNRYVLSTLKSTSAVGIPDGHVLRMVGEPKVGERMAMFGADGVRVVTTVVERIEVDDLGLGTYIHTRNSLYYLEQLRELQAAA